MQRWTVLAMVCSALLAFTLGYLFLNSPETGTGVSAPELAGVDVNGQPVRLSDCRGSVVIVEFWATWCGPCRQMVPSNKSLVQKMAGKRFKFLAVPLQR